MKLQKTYLTLAIFSLVALAAPAVEAQKVYQGEVCSLNEHKLIEEITWQKDLRKAEEIAGKENKMIFWINMVGKMEGAT